MKLPMVSGSEAVKAFRKLGYEFDEQHGSHIILRHVNPATPTPVGSESQGTRQGNPPGTDSRGRADGGGVREPSVESAPA